MPSSNTRRVLLKGSKLSPGACSGTLKSVTTEEQARRINAKDIVFSDCLSPYLCSYCSDAAGFVLTGSEADHTTAFIKECWKPAIGVGHLDGLIEGDVAALDAGNGILYDGGIDGLQSEGPKRLSHRPKTKLNLFVGIPKMAKANAALNADGVGLLRTNLLIQMTGQHPMTFLKSGREDELEEAIFSGISTIAREFPRKPLWVQTMDFATSDLRHFPGDHEAHEENPMLGWRGLMRELDDVKLLELEFRAIRRVVSAGHSNVGILFSLVRDVSEYVAAKKVMLRANLTPHSAIPVGAMFETPSAAIQINEFIASGLDLAFVGLNDLTQYTLAADRENPRMREIYNPANSSVLFLIKRVLNSASRAGKETSMSLQKPIWPYLGELVRDGLASVTVTADALNDVAEWLCSAESE